MPTPAPKPIPEGMHTVTPYLTFIDNCSNAIEFYQKAFGAKLIAPVSHGPDGKILHAMLRIGDSNIMVSDSFGEETRMGNMATLWLYVENADTMFNRAVNAGSKITMPIDDMFWGDRVGQIQDPYGYLWSFATWKWVLTEEEMSRAQEEWMRSSGM